MNGVGRSTVIISTLPLPGGRDVEVHLGNWELDAARPTVLFHHGTPSWGRPARYLLAACAQRGVRMVGLTRGGYSGSGRVPGRTIASVAGDVAAVLDHLDVGEVMVVGWSGGGPHALATAALLPDRVSTVASLSGPAPATEPDLDFLAGMGQGNIEEFGAAFEGEQTLVAALEHAAPGMTTLAPEGLAEAMSSLLPDVDRRALDDDFAAELVEAFRRGLAPGVHGWADDDLAFVAPWGFDPRHLDGRRVTIWQGGQDLMVPAAHGSWLATAVPGARARLLTDDGHLSIVANRSGEILDDLLAPR